MPLPLYYLIPPFWKAGNPMDTKIFHSVNSGLYLFSGRTGILLDGLFGPGPYQCFSPFPAPLRKQMLSRTGMFAHLDALLFSHVHGDHYDADAAYFLRRAHGDLPFYLIDAPDNTLCPQQLAPRITQLAIGDFSVRMLRTAHNGVSRKDPALFRVSHQVFLIRCRKEQFLIAADGLLGKEEAALLTPFGAVDLVFCNAYHLSDPKGLEFLKVLRPSRVALYHLPFEQDDVYRYRSLAKQLISHANGVERPFLLSQMSWLDNAPPSWALNP